MISAGAVNREHKEGSVQRFTGNAYDVKIISVYLNDMMLFKKKKKADLSGPTIKTNRV